METTNSTRETLAARTFPGMAELPPYKLAVMAGRKLRNEDGTIVHLPYDESRPLTMLKVPELHEKEFLRVSVVIRRSHSADRAIRQCEKRGEVMMMGRFIPARSDYRKQLHIAMAMAREY